MDLLLYSEINIFCIVILSVILIHCLTFPQKSTENKFFISAVSFSILATLLDTAKTYIYFYSDFPFSQPISSISGALCLISFITAVFFCFLYMIKAQGSILMKKKYSKTTILCSSVSLGLFILYILLNELSSYISGNGSINSRLSFFLQIFISLIYIIIPALCAALKSLKEKYFTDKGKLISICSFAIYPISCVLFYNMIDVSIIAIPMLTLSYLLVFIETQRRMISVDPVTGLDNRRRIIDYLSAKKKNS